MRRGKSRGNDSPTGPSGISLDSLDQPASTPAASAKAFKPKTRIAYNNAAIAELNRWAAQRKHEMPTEVHVSCSQFPNAVVDRSGKALVKGPKGKMIEVDASPRRTSESYYLPGDRTALTAEAVTGIDTSDSALAGLPDAQRQNLETVRDNNSGKRTSKPALAWDGAHQSIESLTNVENIIADVIREWVHRDQLHEWFMEHDRCWRSWWLISEVWFFASGYRHLRAEAAETFIAMLLWMYPKSGIYSEEKITVTRKRKVGKRTFHDHVDLARTPATFVRHSCYDFTAMREALQMFRPDYYGDNPSKLIVKTLEDMHERLLATIGSAMKDNPAWGERLPPRNAELLAIERRKRNAKRYHMTQRRIRQAFAKPTYDRRFCERMVGRWLTREPSPISFERLAELMKGAMDIVWHKDGWPIEIRPNARVRIHPRYGFGRPRVMEGVATDVLFHEWKAEKEDAAVIAEWHDIAVESVVCAVAFEQGLIDRDPENRKKKR